MAAKKTSAVDFNTLAESQVSEQQAQRAATKAAEEARREFLDQAEETIQSIVDKAAQAASGIFPSGTIEMTIRPDAKATNHIFMSGLKVRGNIPGEGFTYPGEVLEPDEYAVSRV